MSILAEATAILPGIVKKAYLFYEIQKRNNDFELSQIANVDDSLLFISITSVYFIQFDFVQYALNFLIHLIFFQNIVKPKFGKNWMLMLNLFLGEF